MSSCEVTTTQARRRKIVPSSSVMVCKLSIKTKKQDSSKIQGRFYPPLSLSSTNADEVIQSRLLAKPLEVRDELDAVFKQRGDILKNQLTFKNCGMTFCQFKDGEDFVKNYPFAPYQFQLIQKNFRVDCSTSAPLGQI
jgi:hypothetical protein